MGHCLSEEMANATSTAPSPSVIALAGTVQAGQCAFPPKSPMAPMPITSRTSDLPPPSRSLTTKEWVVPPRPKPGRKPATDAPPTKRKAQNRAAQRAFRERRAARVGELEEEIKKMEMEDEEEQNALRARIDKLQEEVEECRTSLNIWIQRCRGLEAELAVESAAKEEALRTSSKEALAPSTSSSTSPKDQCQNGALQEGGEAIGCGNCSSISDCQCIQEVINMQSGGLGPDVAGASSTKRPHSPGYNHSVSKRMKPEPLNELETDFTMAYLNQQSKNTGKDGSSPSPSSAVTDRCGFCTDGTPCICAEMQAAEADHATITNSVPTGGGIDEPTRYSQEQGLEPEHPPSRSSLLPGISQLSHITPPPSDTDVSLLTTSSQKPYSSSKSPCINGPGTCLQCRSDPNSTLFCKSLAKSREQQQQQQQQRGCCSGNARIGNSCCRSTSSQPQPETSKISLTAKRTSSVGKRTDSDADGLGPDKIGDVDAVPQEENLQQHPIITLTCADAYTTLSRHPGYQKAAGEMARWLPRLNPTTTGSKPPDTTPLGSIRHDGNQNNNDCRSGAGRERARARDEAQDQARLRGVSEGNVAGVGVTVSQCRPAMEIDAANVMAVLRDFDRRFS